MKSHESAPVTVDYSEEFVRSESDIQSLRTKLEDGRVALIKRVLSGAECDRLRSGLIAWSLNEGEFPTGHSAQVSDLNFHRINDGSKPAHIDHRMHAFGFGQFDSVSEPLRNGLQIASERLQSLANLIAQTEFSVGVDGLRVMLMHLPRGGGYIARHQHPLMPSKVTLLLVLSRPGKDYQSGGMELKVASGWQLIGSECGLQQGDVIAARSDLPHGFSEIDAGNEITWHSLSGLWGLSCEHLTSYSEARQLATK